MIECISEGGLHKCIPCKAVYSKPSAMVSHLIGHILLGHKIPLKHLSGEVSKLFIDKMNSNFIERMV